MSSVPAHGQLVAEVTEVLRKGNKIQRAANTSSLPFFCYIPCPPGVFALAKFCHSDCPIVDASTVGIHREACQFPVAPEKKGRSQDSVSHAGQPPLWP